MRDTLLLLSRSILSWGVTLLAFGMPIVYSGATLDPFDFPKQIFLYTATLVLAAAWLTKMWLEGEVRLTKTPLDLPLLLFIGVAIVSTVLSYGQIGMTSMSGFFGRFHGGLVSLISLVLLYYIAINTIKSREHILRVLWALVLSGGLLALLGITSALGVSLIPGELASSRTFTPVGSLQALSVYLGLSVVCGLGMFLNGGNHSQDDMVGLDMTLPKRGRGRPRKYEQFVEAHTSDMSDEMHTSQESHPPLTRLKEWVMHLGRASPQTIRLPQPATVLFIILLLCVVELSLLNVRAGWVTLGAGVGVLVFWNRPRILRSALQPLAVLVALSLLVFAVVHIIGVGKKVPALVPLPGEPVMDPQSSWIVAAHTVRDYPIFGSGPGTFFYDFTRYRATGYNQQAFWNMRFTVPHNEYFLYLTTLGILGLFAAITLGIRYFVFAVMTALKGAGTADHPLKVGVAAAGAAVFIGQAFFAHNTTTAAAFILILAMTMALERLLGAAWVDDLKLSLALAPSGGAVSVGEPHLAKSDLASRGKREVMPSLFFYPGIILILILFFFVSKHLSANLAYRASLAAAGRNDGTATYQLQLAAIRSNPLLDQYHLGFAQTNLLLAAALVTKSNPTDQERQTATALVDQAIREARTATELAPLNVANWETLAQIYRNIAGSVPDAASWALQAYQQALTTDPPNPQLRLDVGGLLFAAQQYDAAMQQFQLAVQLKPNLANAWYNLANAFAKKEMYHEALQAYGQAKPHVTPGSGEDKQLEVEMVKIREIIAKAQPSPSPTSIEQGKEEVVNEKLEGEVAGEATATPTPAP